MALAKTTRRPVIDQAKLVDDYVLACAEAANAERAKEAAKQAILASNVTDLRGTLNKVKVSDVDGRKSVDTNRMVLDGLLTQAEVDEYTTTGRPSTRISVSAL